VDKNDPGALVIPFSGEKTVIFSLSKHLVIQFGLVMFGQTFLWCTFYKGQMYIFETSAYKKTDFFIPIRPINKKKDFIS
jgi:hypothetical protein